MSAARPAPPWHALFSRVPSGRGAGSRPGGTPHGPGTPGGTVPMTQVLVSVALDGPATERLRRLPGVTVHTLAPRSKEWDVPPELVRGTEVRRCKVPPRDLLDMTEL